MLACGIVSGCLLVAFGFGELRLVFFFVFDPFRIVGLLVQGEKMESVLKSEEEATQRTLTEEEEKRRRLKSKLREEQKVLCECAENNNPPLID